MSNASPLLFVDIDGVLNPYGKSCPTGYVEHRLFPDDEDPVRVFPAHGRWLWELASSFELVWASGWSEADRVKLGTVLDLPPFQGALELPRQTFEPSLKLPAVAAMAGSRPAAWIDDLITPEAREWALRRPSPTLLIPVDPDCGLTRDHVDRLTEWAASSCF